MIQKTTDDVCLIYLRRFWRVRLREEPTCKRSLENIFPITLQLIKSDGCSVLPRRVANFGCPFSPDTYLRLKVRCYGFSKGKVAMELFQRVHAIVIAPPIELGHYFKNAVAGEEARTMRLTEASAGLILCFHF